MRVVSCGSNNHYEGGTGVRTPPNPSPVNATAFGSDIEEVAAAYHFDIARTAEGRVLAVGWNINGNLGDGTLEEKASPVDIGLADVVKVGAGGAHGFALDVYGRLFVWGTGPIGDGQVHGEGSNHPSPYQVPGTFTDAWSGGPNMFARDAVGNVWGWGDGQFYQFGNGLSNDLLSPAIVGRGYVEVASAGTGKQTAHTLFLTPSGEVLACGSNKQGQSAQPPSAVVRQPSRVPLSPVRKILADRLSSHALTTTGELWGWGKLPHESSYQPKLLATDVADAWCGSESLYVLIDNVILAIGNNASGQLGDGTQEDKSEFVETLEGVREVSSGTADGVSHTLHLSLEPVTADVSISARSIPGGLVVEWVAGETAKPWAIKHRLVTYPKSDWTHDGQANARIFTLNELESGKEYEVFVQNGDFGWKIVRGVAG